MRRLFLSLRAVLGRRYALSERYQSLAAMGFALGVMLSGVSLTGCHRHQKALPREAVHPWPPVFGSADRGATPLHHSFRGDERNDVPAEDGNDVGSMNQSMLGVPFHGSPSVDSQVVPVNYDQPLAGSINDQTFARVSAAPIGGDAAVYISAAEPIRFAAQADGSDSIEMLPGVAAGTPAVQVEDVLASVLAHYPMLMAAQLERGIAQGQVVSRWGEFDTQFKAYSLDRPVGFYENYRQGLGFDQPLFAGGSVSGGYRLGDGTFEPWYKERETNEGGELAVAVGFPLLKGRVIDERRAELLRSTLALQAVEPLVRTEMIASLREGSAAYWTWVSAGQSVDAHRRLLALAEMRIENIEALIAAGDQPPVVRLDNRRLLASRQAKLIDAERKLATSAIKLSLFLRDEAGTPWVPSNDLIPALLPDLPSWHPESLSVDRERALNNRPEFLQLSLMREQELVALAKAENDMLPKFDASVGAAQDLGARASKTGDKSPLEMDLGLVGEMPLQFRMARGKIEAQRNKLRQIDVKRNFVADKVIAELNAADATLQASLNAIEQDRIHLQTAQEALNLARISFDNGDIDLIVLNIYEQTATDAELNLIEAQAQAFVAEVDYLAALGDLGPAMNR